MSLPFWLSKYDANIYRSLSLFPEKLESKPLSQSEFTIYFKDFEGRPVQDIVEALHKYGKKGYLKFELTLSSNYFEQGNFLAEAMAKLSGSNVVPDKYHGLGSRVYAKVLDGRPLTKAEASNLPDNAKPYLAFSLSDIDRLRLRAALAVYEGGVNRPVIRQGKVTTKLPPLNISDIHLKPENYDKAKGILYLTQFHDRQIAGKAGVKRPNGKKYEQCWVMERVFMSNKTLKDGVEISTILGVSKSVAKTTTKKIENTKTAINNKVAANGGPKNLLKIQNNKIFLNNSYL
jgi:hypothetical protein